MKETNVIRDKSKAFAIRIVSLYKTLTIERREYILSKQILRSGTSIGANVAESVYAISRADFLSKLYIALKETSETEYWLGGLLEETEYITSEEYTSLREDCRELLLILSSITKSLKDS